MPDSGGPGRRRGGLAVRRDLVVTAPEITVSALMDRVKRAPGGSSAASPAAAPRLLVRRAGETDFRDFSEAFGTVSPSKFSGVVLREGDAVLIESAGGGGYGDPASASRRWCSPTSDGLVTPGAARDTVSRSPPAAAALDAGRTGALRR